MSSVDQKRPRILSTIGEFWIEERREKGVGAATGKLFGALWEFARDSTPDRLRARFGDADYDWDHRVNTTSGAVGWRDRLIGQFLTAYQPTGEAFFSEMMDALQQQTNSSLQEFTFLDLGSGKGRALLMASHYPFRRILGVELLPSLNQIAQENITQYKSESQRCFAIESICADATSFAIPEGPLVLYLFNPFPEFALRRSLGNLQRHLSSKPRPFYLLYHNPVFEHILESQPFLRKLALTYQYSLYTAAPDR